MLRRPTTSTRTNTLFPYTTLFRSPECKVGNIWIDRSGREPIPHAQVEPYDDMWIIKADQWLGDVLYAVRVGEEASKDRSEEHTSELQSLMRISYAVFCLKKKKYTTTQSRSTTYQSYDKKTSR